MRIARRLGIIGGNGWLGNAIASAAVARGVIAGEDILVSGRSSRPGRLPVPGAGFTHDNALLAREADVVILSVRPQDFPAIRIDAGGKPVISVMAGVTVAQIAAQTGARGVIRAIPNAAAAIGRSFTPWFAGPGTTAEDRALADMLFTACGESAELALESQVDFCAGLTGSGAAFPALLAEALAEAARAQGLPGDFARRAARGVVAMAAQLLLEADPATVIEEMLGYAGTTAAALGTMRAEGFGRAVAAGLAAASARGAVLGAAPTAPRPG